MKYVPQGYSETDDCFANVLIASPEFRNRGTTVEEAFQRLNLGIDSVIARAKEPEAVELLQRCKAETAVVLAMFKANVAGDKEQRKEAKLRLQRAYNELYLKAGQLLKPGVEIGPDDDV